MGATSVRHHKRQQSEFRHSETRKRTTAEYSSKRPRPQSGGSRSSLLTPEPFHTWFRHWLLRYGNPIGSVVLTITASHIVLGHYHQDSIIAGWAHAHFVGFLLALQEERRRRSGFRGIDRRQFIRRETAVTQPRLLAGDGGHSLGPFGRPAHLSRSQHRDCYLYCEGVRRRRLYHSCWVGDPQNRSPAQHRRRHLLRDRRSGGDRAGCRRFR